MLIEFDNAKRDLTLSNRDLDMARANEIFGGQTITVEDTRNNYGEARFITIGFLDLRMVIIVWTQRENTRRIISLRKANDRERDYYTPRMV
jgi:uncharacterized protein